MEDELPLPTEGILQPPAPIVTSPEEVGTPIPSPDAHSQASANESPTRVLKRGDLVRSIRK